MNSPSIFNKLRQRMAVDRRTDRSAYAFYGRRVIFPLGSARRCKSAWPPDGHALARRPSALFRAQLAIRNQRPLRPTTATVKPLLLVTVQMVAEPDHTPHLTLTKNA